MFQRLQSAISGDAARMIFRVRISQQVSGEAGQQVSPSVPRDDKEMEEKKKLALQGAEEPTGDFEDEAKEVAEVGDIGRPSVPRDNKMNNDGRPSVPRDNKMNNDGRPERVEVIASGETPPKAVESSSQIPRQARNDNGGVTNHGAAAVPVEDTPIHGAVVRDPNEKKEKVGRNDPCPCGSGKKYKKCHGA